MRSHQAEGDLEAGLQHGLPARGTSCWKELPEHFRKAKYDFHFLMADGAKGYIERAFAHTQLGAQVLLMPPEALRDYGKKFGLTSRCGTAS